MHTSDDGRDRETLSGEERQMTGRTSSMRVGAGVAVILSLILASCAGSGSTMPAGQNFTPDQVSRFVIAKGDLPSEFKNVNSDTRLVPCDSGWLANRGALTENADELAVKQNLLALGPQRCQVSLDERRIRDTAGAVVGASGFQIFAVVFPDSNAASKALPLFRAQFSDPYLAESYAEEGQTPGAPEDLLNPGLGDESTPGIKREPAPGLSPDYTYIWRVRNVALVLGGGADLGEEEILRMAMNISARAVK